MQEERLIDDELIRRIQNSDAIAFKTLYFRYHQRLGSYIYNRIHSSEQTRDMLQEIFAWLWQNRIRLRIKTSLSAYLYRMAHNMTVNLYQKKSRKRAYIASRLYQTDVVSGNVTDMQIDLETAMNALPEKLRTVFILSRFEGLKNSEIAETLNVSVKTVESRITKVLKILREIFTSK